MLEKQEGRKYTTAAKKYKIRPDYLRDQVDTAIAALGITPDHVVVDVGAGTGKLTKMFDGHCKELIAVDHSPDMQANFDPDLQGRVRLIEGTASATTLPDHSVDFVVMGDAAHWFKAEETTAEFKRILKPGGKVGVFVRIPDPQSPVVQKLDALLTMHCDDYSKDGANKLAGDEELMAEKKGRHLLAEEGKQSFSWPKKEGGVVTEPDERLIMKWSKGDLLDYLQSRSSTQTWALENIGKAQQVVDQVFAEHPDQVVDGRLRFPYTSHIAVGNVREYEKLVDVKALDVNASQKIAL